MSLAFNRFIATFLIISLSVSSVWANSDDDYELEPREKAILTVSLLGAAGLIALISAGADSRRERKKMKYLEREKKAQLKKRKEHLEFLAEATETQRYYDLQYLYHYYMGVLNAAELAERNDDFLLAAERYLYFKKIIGLGDDKYLYKSDTASPKVKLATKEQYLYELRSDYACIDSLIEVNLAAFASLNPQDDLLLQWTSSRCDYVEDSLIALNKKLFTIEGEITQKRANGALQINGLALPVSQFDGFKSASENGESYTEVLDENILGIISKPSIIAITVYDSQLKNAGIAIHGEQIQLTDYQFDGYDRDGRALFSPAYDIIKHRMELLVEKENLIKRISDSVYQMEKVSFEKYQVLCKAVKEYEEQYKEGH